MTSGLTSMLRASTGQAPVLQSCRVSDGDRKISERERSDSDASSDLLLTGC